MSARLVGALTSEMQTEDHTVKPEEIAVLQENELRAHAPALVKTVEDAARKPLEEKVAEMEQKDEAAKPVLDFIPQLRATLGLADDASPLDVLKAGYEEIRKAGKSVRDSLLSEILEKKFGKERDPLVDRILTAEMSPDFRPTGKKDDDYKKVEEMVNSIVDGDEALKEKVSEMQGTPTAPAITGKDRGGKKKVEPGYESTGLRVRSA